MRKTVLCVSLALVVLPFAGCASSGMRNGVAKRVMNLVGLPVSQRALNYKDPTQFFLKTFDWGLWYD